MERRYVIPTFRRDYEGTLDGRWRVIHEDLLAAAEPLQRARYEADALNEILGARTRSDTTFPRGDSLRSTAFFNWRYGPEVRRRRLQQPLTMLQLLTQGILDVLQEAVSPRCAQMRRLISNPSDAATNPLDRLKLWPRCRDRQVWPDAIGDDIPTGNAHAYLSARKFFANETRAAICDDSDGELLDAIVDAF